MPRGMPLASISSTSTVKSKLLETLAKEKLLKLLPPIDKTKLLKPTRSGRKISAVKYCSKLPTLAVKLCKESYFGKQVMSLCTVKGTGQFHALPEVPFKELRRFLLDLSIPILTPTRLEFEVTWKNCVESIGQACKGMRKSQTVKPMSD